MPVHLDSSVVAAVVLREPKVVEFWELADILFVSDLVAVEVRRAIHRLRLNGQFSDDGVADSMAALAEMEEGLTFLGISREVLNRASGAFSSNVRTLDAIHLATAAVNAEDLDDPDPITFVTHDRRLARAARALGYTVIGVDVDSP
ncbi:MAG: type II toxin-antitoxin system VapC family toxin [Dehalococcoidia bacterium]